MKINVDLDFLTIGQLNIILENKVREYNTRFEHNKIYLENSIYTLYKTPTYLEDTPSLIAAIELLITTTHEMSVYVLNAINKVLIERDKRL